MTELSEEDKARIILEEQFRSATKAEIEAQKPKKPVTTWELMNSSLVLLLMSSVVISGIGSLFTMLKASHEKKLAKEADLRVQEKRAVRINSEIGYRVSVLLVSLSVASENPNVDIAHGKLGKDHTETEIKQGLRAFIKGRVVEGSNLYPEFGNSSTLQLATELYKSDQNEKNHDLGQVIADMSAIDLMPAETYANPVKVASIIQEKLDMYPPWRQGNFYFTDCSPKEPFC